MINLLPPRPPSSPAHSDRKSVLIIDGNREDREYFADRLAPEYFTFLADSGKTGLDCFYTHHIDCVVLELDLPNMSGFEILIELVPIARRPTVPVVVLTTLSNFMLSELVEKNGAQVCLHKAITSGDVLSKAVFRAIEAVPRTGKEQREVFDFPRRETTGRKMDQPPTGQ